MTKYRIFIDESGQLGVKERFFVITLCVMDKKNQKKWKKLSGKILNNLNRRGVHSKEIKAYEIGYKDKKKILKKIEDHEIEFTLFIGLIDKKHPHFIKRFQTDSGNMRELSVNYVVCQLLKSKQLTSLVECNSNERETSCVEIFMDTRNVSIENRKSLEDYLKTELYIKGGRQQIYKVYYKNSEHCKGVQLADIISNIIFSNKEYGVSNHLYKKIQRYVKVVFKYPQFD